MMMKHYIHLLAPLCLWAIALALYIVTVTNEIPRKIDSVKTYQLQKKPHSFDDAWYSIRETFANQWANDDCYTLTSLSASPTCVTARSALVTSIHNNLECSKYTSQACKCVQQITGGIYNPSNASHVYKTLAGRKDTTIQAIEACRWLMHNAHTAVSTGKTYAQRSVLLLFITTLATGNAFNWIVLNYFLRSSSIDNTSRAAMNTLSLIFWAMLTFIISVPIETDIYMLLLYIILPPIVTLVLYEFYHLTYHIPEKPFIHPYVFCCVLGALALLAHIEMGITDWDVLVFEIIKSNIAGLIYLQVVWKYMIRVGKNDFSYSKFVQEGTLRAVILVFILYLAGLMAPYTVGCTSMVMWYAPLLWVVFAFASVTWVTSFHYNEFFGGKLSVENHVRPTWEISTASTYVSAIELIFILLLLLYYLRENATVYLALVNNFPVDSIQYNSRFAWQRAPVVAAIS